MAQEYTITSVSANAPEAWESAHGTMHKYKVKLSGVQEIVFVNKKPGNTPEVGQKLYGDVTTNKYGTQFKAASKPEFAQKGDNFKRVNQKDEQAIKAMWAIGQAVAKVDMNIDPKNDSGVQSGIVTVESLARELFDMVERVKAGTTADFEDIKDDDGFLDAIAEKDEVNVDEIPF